MQTITTAIKGFIDDENGVTAIEYGLIAALIAAAIATVVGTLGTSLSAMFTGINAKL